MLLAPKTRGLRLRLPFSELPHEGPTCQVSRTRPGKQLGRPLVAAAGSSTGTISIKDYLSGREFLIDSGADECVFPAKQADCYLPRSSDLVAANGSAIHTYGKRRLPISFAAGHKVFHTFWIASVSRPILGADFFFDNEILIDIGGKKLTTRSGQSFPATLTLRPSIFGIRLPAAAPYESLLEEFPLLLQQNFHAAVKHKVKHFILTTGPQFMPAHVALMTRNCG